ncbi:hypothetical protein J0H58_24715 [bacterium]|nr:hypothetical protein [bacterium]
MGTAATGFAGIDVSKDTLDACPLGPDGRARGKPFGNDPRGHAALAAWADRQAGGQGNKTDPADARAIATFIRDRSPDRGRRPRKSGNCRGWSAAGTTSGGWPRPRRPGQPSPATLAFMSLQESVIGFHRDPALFLACPIAAEGFAVHAQANVLDGLGRSIASWGLARPADVAHFVRSHSGFDGGADGHWNRCVGMVGKYIRTAARIQQFAALVRAAVSALANHYDSCVLEYADPPPKG